MRLDFMLWNKAQEGLSSSVTVLPASSYHGDDVLGLVP